MRNEFWNNNLTIIRRIIISCFIIFYSIFEAYSQKYFQQEVNLKINVTLNDKLHELNAFETLEYINNSPDTLRFLFFHLWPNGYSSNNTELAKQLFTINGKQKLFKDPELEGYIDSLNFRIDDMQVQWSLLPNQPDICQIILNKPLLNPQRSIFKIRAYRRILSNFAMVS